MGAARVKRALSGAVVASLLCGLFAYSPAVMLLVVNPMRSVRQDHLLSRQIRRTSLVSWEAPPAGIDGRSVLISGRIEASIHDNSSLRTDGSWEWDSIERPNFDLIGPGARVRITNGCHRRDNHGLGHLLNIRYTLDIAAPCYRLGGRMHESSVASRGFSPGETVTVIGRWHHGSVHASAVFGGPPGAYAASLERGLWVTALIGCVAGGFLVVWPVLWGTRNLMRRRRRTKARQPDVDEQ